VPKAVAEETSAPSTALTVPPAAVPQRPDLSRLVVKGAREHNLRNVDLDLPRDAMIVFTGLSGSGKSSLAFDTIFAEGQRRYV
jgi:excinuclease ABC subunit A